jgi:predicted nucleic acid-binding protein
MTFLLDTNVVSELTKPAPDAKCVAWVSARADDCAISTVTLAELRFGVERLPAGKRKAALERDFAFLLEDYSGRFFEFDGPAAVEWGRYAAELEAAAGTDWWKHYDFRDTQIAAIAREYGLKVVTRNAKHFPFVAAENPFA